MEPLPSPECFGLSQQDCGWMLWFQLTHHPGEVDLGLLPVSELLKLLGGSPDIHPESIWPQKCPYNSCPEEKSSSKCALLDPVHPFLETWEQEPARAWRMKPSVLPGTDWVIKTVFCPCVCSAAWAHTMCGAVSRTDVCTVYVSFLT